MKSSQTSRHAGGWSIRGGFQVTPGELEFEVYDIDDQAADYR
jgi:hypothetical protein